MLTCTFKLFLEKQVEKKYTWKAVWLFCSVVLMASNLRAPITSVGPVIPEMIEKLGMTPFLTSLVTTIPLICFALGSTFMPRISRVAGIEKTLLYSIILLALGLFIRPAGNLFFIFLGSAFIGIAITIGNVLMPPFIKKTFPEKVGPVTAAYLISMNLTSAIAVGYSIDMGRIGHLGWKASIGIWGFLSVIAFFFWLPALKTRSSKAAVQHGTPSRNIWKSRLAWQISVFMGTQSVVFYVLAAWFPTILQGWGMEAKQAGWVLSYIQIGQVPMMLIGPLLADKTRDQRMIVWMDFILLLAGLLLIIFWKTRFLIVASLFIGIAVGLAFALATMFFAIRTRNVAEAAQLSGMAQSVGYFIAACFPPLFGVLYGWTRSWEVPLFTLLGMAILLLITGIPASKDRLITEKK